MMHHAYGYLFIISVETIFSEVDLNACMHKIYDKFTMDTVCAQQSHWLALAI